MCGLVHNYNVISHCNSLPLHQRQEKNAVSTPETMGLLVTITSYFCNLYSQAATFQKFVGHHSYLIPYFLLSNITLSGIYINA